ncbi:hypothetical protein ACOMHN_061868 [Nucella lapillus]
MSDDVRLLAKWGTSNGLERSVLDQDASDIDHEFGDAALGLSQSEFCGWDGSPSPAVEEADGGSESFCAVVGARVPLRQQRPHRRRNRSPGRYHASPGRSGDGRCPSPGSFHADVSVGIGTDQDFITRYITPSRKTTKGAGRESRDSSSGGDSPSRSEKVTTSAATSFSTTTNPGIVGGSSVNGSQSAADRHCSSDRDQDLGIFGWLGSKQHYWIGLDQDSGRTSRDSARTGGNPPRPHKAGHSSSSSSSPGGRSREERPGRDARPKRYAEVPSRYLSPGPRQNLGGRSTSLGRHQEASSSDRNHHQDATRGYASPGRHQEPTSGCVRSSRNREDLTRRYTSPGRNTDSLSRYSAGNEDSSSRHGARNEDSSNRYCARNPDSASTSRYYARNEDSSSRYGARNEDSSSRYSGRNEDSSSRYSGRNKDSSSRYSARNEDSSSRYSARNEDSSSRYGARNEDSSSRHGARNEDPSSRYGARNEDPSSRYGARNEDSSSRYGARNEDSSSRYGARNEDSSSRHGARNEDSSSRYSARNPDRYSTGTDQNRVRRCSVSPGRRSDNRAYTSVGSDRQTCDTPVRESRAGRHGSGSSSGSSSAPDPPNSSRPRRSRSAQDHRDCARSETLYHRPRTPSSQLAHSPPLRENSNETVYSSEKHVGANKLGPSEKSLVDDGDERDYLWELQNLPSPSSYEKLEEEWNLYASQHNLNLAGVVRSASSSHLLPGSSGNVQSSYMGVVPSASSSLYHASHSSSGNNQSSESSVLNSSSHSKSKQSVRSEWESKSAGSGSEDSVLSVFEASMALLQSSIAVLESSTAVPKPSTTALPESSSEFLDSSTELLESSTAALNRLPARDCPGKDADTPPANGDRALSELLHGDSDRDSVDSEGLVALVSSLRTRSKSESDKLDDEEESSSRQSKSVHFSIFPYVREIPVMFAARQKTSRTVASLVTPERSGRTRSRIGVSQSQPGSRSTSPSSRGSYLTHMQPGRDPMTPKGKRKSAIPRSQGASRETSPNRHTYGRERRLSGSKLSHTGTGLISQRLLRHGSDVEDALHDALSRPLRKRYEMYDSDDAASETSSVCSERSYTSYSGRTSEVSRSVREGGRGEGGDKSDPTPPTAAAHQSGRTSEVSRSVRQGGREGEGVGVQSDPTPPTAVAHQRSVREGGGGCSERSYTSYSGRTSEVSRSVREGGGGCSERSYTSYSGRTSEDMSEIIALLGSGSYSERKDGLISLLHLLRSSRYLSRVELKKVTEVFTRMFHDPHSKVFSIFLDTLTELCLVHGRDLCDWLYVLLTRLLNKTGTDMLGSVNAKLLRTLDTVRDTFPCDSQFNTITKFIIDQTQSPNLKVKISMLNFLHGLITVMEPVDFVNTMDTRLAVSRIINWTMEPRNVEVRKSAQLVLIGLFNLNPPEFSLMLAALPKAFQDGATKILHSHMRSASECMSDVLSPRNATSPVGQQRSRPPSRQSLGHPEECETENMNPEDIYNSIKKTSADIQNLSLGTKLDGYEDIKKKRDFASQDSGIQELRNDSPDGVETRRGTLQHVYNPQHYQEEGGLNGFGKSLMMEDGDSAACDTETTMSDVLRELSNHNERVRERRKMLDTLLKWVRNGTISEQQWDEHFKSILLILIETFNDTDKTMRMDALIVFRSILKRQAARFKDYAELTILKICEAHKDPSKDVQRAAEECALVIPAAISPEQALPILNNIIHTAKFPIHWAAIKMQVEVVKLVSSDFLERSLPSTVPGLIMGYDDSDSRVRKAAVFCLVNVYLQVGESIRPYLCDLNSSKTKLLNLYIKRAQEDSRSGIMSPVASDT